MEWLDSFLPLVLFAVYFLAWLWRQARRSGKAAPNTPAPRRAAAAAPQRATPFEELIRQIQRASEEAKRAQQQAATPAPPPARPQEFVSLEPAPAPGAQEFHELGSFEHEQHSFDPANPFSEEAFEHLTRGADVTAHAPGHLDYDPHGLARPTASARRAHPLVERLRRPGTAREAFAIREILDAPLAHRRRR